MADGGNGKMGQPRHKCNAVTNSFELIMRPKVGFESACSHETELGIDTAFKRALSLILVQLS